MNDDEATIYRFPSRPSTEDHAPPGATTSALTTIRALYAESLDERAVAEVTFPPPFADVVVTGGDNLRKGFALSVAALMTEIATRAADRHVTVTVEEATAYLEGRQSAGDTVAAAMVRSPSAAPQE